MTTPAAKVEKYEYKWTANKEGTSWTMHFWPFYLTIDFRPKEPQPYVGSLGGKLITLREHHAWNTPEEAAVGMLDWALKELAEGYEELRRVRGI